MFRLVSDPVCNIAAYYEVYCIYKSIDIVKALFLNLCFKKYQKDVVSFFSISVSLKICILNMCMTFEHIRYYTSQLILKYNSSSVAICPSVYALVEERETEKPCAVSEKIPKNLLVINFL